MVLLSLRDCALFLFVNVRKWDGIYVIGFTITVTSAGIVGCHLHVSLHSDRTRNKLDRVQNR